jgi:hypothetical protein
LGLVEPVSLTESIIDLDTVLFSRNKSGTITTNKVATDKVPSVNLLDRNLVERSNGTTSITFDSY